MKEFKVEITETLTRTIPVQAETSREALEIIRQARSSGDIILDYNDFQDVEFVVAIDKDPQFKALLVQPDKAPVQISIANNLKDFQKIVGGSIAVANYTDESVGIICNDEGKLLGLQPNRAIYDNRGKCRDIVCGNFLVIGVGEDDFKSLSPELLEKYEKLFEKPDKFNYLGGIIVPQMSQSNKPKQNYFER